MAASAPNLPTEAVHRTEPVATFENLVEDPDLQFERILGSLPLQAPEAKQTDEDKATEVKSLPDSALMDPIHVVWNSSDRKMHIDGRLNGLLAARVLNQYMDPVAVVARTQYRSMHFDAYWTELTRDDRLKMIQFTECDYCDETTWCLVKNRQGQRLRNAQCDHCFYLEDLE